MNKNMKTRIWRLMLLSLLACGCVTLTALAQTSGQPVKPEPAIPDGYVIVDGDIVMPKRVVEALREAVRLGVAAAPEANYRVKLWTRGHIPYQFQTVCAPSSTCANAPPSGCVSPANQTIMRAAMNVLENVANVKFLSCPNNRCREGWNYLNIRDTTNDTTPISPTNNTCQNDSKNSSQVGMVGGSQNLNIVSWTGATAQWIIIHELLHALGIYHEQSRLDRDTYVEIFCANVQGGCLPPTNELFKANFSIEGVAYGPYDFDSLMHYGQCDFSANPSCPTPPPPPAPGQPAMFPDGGITIRVKEPFRSQWQTRIGQRALLSALDQLTLSFLYPQPNWRFVDVNAGAQQNGYFLLPYKTLDIAVQATPAGGTIWQQPGTYTLAGELRKQVTLKAPLGGVTIRQGTRTVAGFPLTSVSAASYGGELAADSIVAAFGLNLAASTAVARSLPLPTTLAGVTVKVTDSEKVTRDAPLFFVSPSQINYLVPTGTKPGLAEIAVFNGGNQVAKSETPVNPVAPALFTADASGKGPPAAVALRVRADGSQSTEPVARYDAALQRFVPVPIDLGPESDQVFLILYGTGFRAGSESDSVATFIGDEIAETLFAGAAPGFAGLDQANVRMPRSLAGKGEVSVLLLADNRASNAVTVNVR